MPFINLISKPNKALLTEGGAVHIRKVCSKLLSCEENHLSVNDFSITQIEPIYALLSADTEIRIYAHNYQSREESIDEISHKIQEEIQSYYTQSKIKVYLFLMPIGFASD